MNFLKQYKDYMSISNNNIKTNTNLLSALKKVNSLHLSLLLFNKMCLLEFSLLT